jgi:hypothetical protein
MQYFKRSARKIKLCICVFIFPINNLYMIIQITRRAEVSGIAVSIFCICGSRGVYVFGNLGYSAAFIILKRLISKSSRAVIVIADTAFKLITVVIEKFTLKLGKL